ncbi:hypothetical protein C0J52_20284 [Blattella germanica]|nr:hypothetical protein C0J52_20284 [Blattella germanica]
MEVQRRFRDTAVKLLTGTQFFSGTNICLKMETFSDMVAAVGRGMSKPFMKHSHEVHGNLSGKLDVCRAPRVAHVEIYRWSHKLVEITHDFSAIVRKQNGCSIMKWFIKFDNALKCSVSGDGKNSDSVHLREPQHQQFSNWSALALLLHNCSCSFIDTSSDRQLMIDYRLKVREKNIDILKH